MTIFPGCKCCGPCWKCYGLHHQLCKSEDDFYVVSVELLEPINNPGYAVDTTDSGWSVGSFASPPPNISPDVCDVFFGFVNGVNPYRTILNMEISFNRSINEIKTSFAQGFSGQVKYYDEFRGQDFTSTLGPPSGIADREPVLLTLGENILSLTTAGDVALVSIKINVELVELNGSPLMPAMEYQCFDAPPDEDGWTPVGKCSATEEECAAECPPCLTDRCDDPEAQKYICVDQSFSVTDRVAGSFAGAENYFDEVEERLNYYYFGLPVTTQSEFEKGPADPYINPFFASAFCQPNGLYFYSVGYMRRFSRNAPGDNFPGCFGAFQIENQTRDPLANLPDNYTLLYGLCTSSDDAANSFIFPDLSWEGNCQYEERTKTGSFRLRGYYLNYALPSPIEDWSCTLNITATFSYKGCEQSNTTPLGGRTMPTKTTGPGTQLKNMLAAWGIQSKEAGKCGCKSMEKKMNRLGGACLEPKNLKMIVDHLQAEAKKRHLPFVRKAGEMLVKRAVHKSQQNS